MGLFFCEFFPHERIIRSRRLYFPVWEGRELNIPLPSASFHSEKSVLHFSSLGLGTVVVELCSEVQHFLHKMASVQLYLKLVGLALLLTMLSFQGEFKPNLLTHFVNPLKCVATIIYASLALRTLGKTSFQRK